MDGEIQLETSPQTPSHKEQSRKEDSTSPQDPEPSKLDSISRPKQLAVPSPSPARDEQTLLQAHPPSLARVRLPESSASAKAFKHENENDKETDCVGEDGSIDNEDGWTLSDDWPPPAKSPAGLYLSTIDTRIDESEDIARHHFPGHASVRPYLARLRWEYHWRRFLISIVFVGVEALAFLGPVIAHAVLLQNAKSPYRLVFGLARSKLVADGCDSPDTASSGDPDAVFPPKDEL